MAAYYIVVYTLHRHAIDHNGRGNQSCKSNTHNGIIILIKSITYGYIAITNYS